MNIFVGNLAKHVTSDDLRSAFSGYGTVINAIIVRDTVTGQSLGHGHVYLVPEKTAREAVTALNHVVLRGKPIVVRECAYRARRDRRVNKQPWSGEERRRSGERRHYGLAKNPDITNQQQHSSSDK